MPKVTEKPAVYESRQVDKDDKDSDWVLVNVDDETDVRTVSNEVYRNRYSRSRAGDSSSANDDKASHVNKEPGQNRGAGATPENANPGAN